MNCSREGGTGEIWAVIVGVIVLLIVYGVVSSKWKAYRQRKHREKTLPFVEDTLRQGVLYNVFLSDGTKYLGVQLAGTSDASKGPSISGWDGMLVLMRSNGKRVFVRQGSARCVEEV